MKISRFIYLSLFLLLNFISQAQNPAFAWAAQMGGPSIDQAAAIVTDASGNVWSTGTFSGSVDFDPGPGLMQITSGGAGSNAYVSKIDAAGNFLLVANFNNTSNGTGITIDPSGNIIVVGNAVIPFKKDKLSDAFVFPVKPVTNTS